MSEYEQKQVDRKRLFWALKTVGIAMLLAILVMLGVGAAGALFFFGLKLMAGILGVLVDLFTLLARFLVFALVVVSLVFVLTYFIRKTKDR